MIAETLHAVCLRWSLSTVLRLCNYYTTQWRVTCKREILIIARGRYIYIKLVHLLAEAAALRQACLAASRLAQHRRAATAHNHGLGVAEDSCAVRTKARVKASVS